MVMLRSNLLSMPCLATLRCSYTVYGRLQSEDSDCTVLFVTCVR